MRNRGSRAGFPNSHGSGQRPPGIVIPGALIRKNCHGGVTRATSPVSRRGYGSQLPPRLMDRRETGMNPVMIQQTLLSARNQTSRSPVLTRLFFMNENSTETLPQDEEVETFSAWLKRNRLDRGKPWLFFGEDESFEDAF